MKIQEEIRRQICEHGKAPDEYCFDCVRQRHNEDMLDGRFEEDEEQPSLANGLGSQRQDVELLPCPFCGAQYDAPYTNNVGDTWARIKHDAPCFLAFVHNREQWISGLAFTRWNTRTQPSSVTSAEEDTTRALEFVIELHVADLKRCIAVIDEAPSEILQRTRREFESAVTELEHVLNASRSCSFRYSRSQGKRRVRRN